jgi:hypothetical protein
MKVDDVYLKVLFTIVVLCLIAATIKYVKSDATKIRASVGFSSALPVVAMQTVEAPSKQNAMGFTARPFLPA